MTNILLVFGLILLWYELISGTPFLPIAFTLAILVFILVIRNFKQEERIKNLEKTIQEILGIKDTTITKKEIKPMSETLIKKPGITPATEIKPSIKPLVAAKEIKPPIPVYQKPAENQVITWIKSWIMTGNPIAKIGILILFFGVAFLLKYVATHYDFPISYRLIGVFITGSMMVGIGWMLPAERRSYANILQGGGIGLMYFTIFAAFSLYHLLQAEPAFLILIIIVALSGLIAVMRDAQSLAITGILGGFLAPILINTGVDNHIFLFSYYLILNAGILSIAWFKSWEYLTFIGFIFTFIVSTLWGFQSYLPENYFSTQIFLILFFVFYVCCSILFTSRHVPGKDHTLDMIITFGTPAIAFFLQSELVKNIHYGLAWSAFILAIFYACTAYAIYLLNANVYKKLSEIFAGLAVLFGTITIPLTFSKIWTGAFWALESLVLMWYGVKQNQVLIRLAAGLILLASTIVFVFYGEDRDNYHSFINEYYLSGILIVIANLWCSYLLHKRANPRTENDLGLAIIFFVIGVVGWYFLNIQNILEYTAYQYQFVTILLFVVNTSLIASEFLEWKWLRYPAFSIVPFMMLLSIPIYPLEYYHASGSLLSWLISFGILYFILHRNEKDPEPYLPFLHLFSFILVIWFVAMQITVTLLENKINTFIWHYIAWGIVPSILLCLVCYTKKFIKWPLRKYELMYVDYGGYIIGIYLFAWFLASSLLAGDIPSLVYIPFINPIDATIILAIIAMFIWYKTASKWLSNFMTQIKLERILELISLGLFIWLNAILLRTLHHWYAIPYSMPELWDSMLVQACLSILWTILALIATYIAARYQHRILWFLGFTLIWMVIIKLFLVDLINTNTLERVFTFLGVGILLLINGYISPLPPKENKQKRSEKIE